MLNATFFEKTAKGGGILEIRGDERRLVARSVNAPASFRVDTQRVPLGE